MNAKRLVNGCRKTKQTLCANDCVGPSISRVAAQTMVEKPPVSRLHRSASLPGSPHWDLGRSRLPLVCLLPLNGINAEKGKHHFSHLTFGSVNCYVISAFVVVFFCFFFFYFIFASPWDFGDFNRPDDDSNYWRWWKVFHSISHEPHQLSKSTALKKLFCSTACIRQDQVCIKEGRICISCISIANQRIFPNRISALFLLPGKEW